MSMWKMESTVWCRLPYLMTNMIIMFMKTRTNYLRPTTKFQHIFCENILLPKKKHTTGGAAAFLIFVVIINCYLPNNISSSQWARKLKKSRAKKLVNSNKSISRKIFLTKFHFLQFQNDQKSIFELVKILKVPEM